MTVVNVYDHNYGWLTVPFNLNDPAAAHTGHSKNHSVLRMMLEGKPKPLQ